jgi:hypothetical protein
MFDARMTTLRFLVAAPLSAAPSGRVTSLSGERLADVMTRLAPRLRVTVPDMLGAAGRRDIEIAFDRPRAMRLEDVCDGSSPLRELRALAGELARERQTSALTAAIPKVRALVGDGVLVGALAAIASTPASTATPATPAAGAGATGGGEDAAPGGIFDQADIPAQRADPKSRVDAFVSSMRGGARSAGTVAGADACRQAAETILGAVETTALAALAMPQARALESAWRAIKMIVAAAPTHDRAAIDLLDADESGLVAALERVAQLPPAERPDAVFALHERIAMGAVARLARAAERARVAVVVGLDAGLLIGAEPAALAAWLEVRADPALAWVGAAVNDVVLASEPSRAGPRVVFGSPAAAVAAMILGSLARADSLDEVVGLHGAFIAPATWRDDDGEEIATRSPLSVSVQRVLADSGLAALGHERNRVVAIALPTVHDDGGPGVPARLLVGRAIRLAEHVRDRLSPGATPAEIVDAFDRASAIVLPRARPGSCRMRARPGEGGRLDIDLELGRGALGSAIAMSFVV